MIYPNRSIGDDQSGFLKFGGLRRGGASRLGRLPFSLARRLSASIATNCSKAMRTTVARSVMPEYSMALAKSSSSMFIVVRMHDKWHQMMSKSMRGQLSIQSLKKLSCAVRKSERGIANPRLPQSLKPNTWPPVSPSGKAPIPKLSAKSIVSL
jgi:hypothetical protein